MNVYDGIHWNIYDILPYQRNFNFINSRRNSGKTYTTLFYLLNEAIEKNKEFVYIVRTKSEKDKYALKRACEKTINQQYSSYNFDSDTNSLYIIEKNVKRPLAHCIALSEENTLKNYSYPNVFYIIFDEYVIEETSRNTYYNGWDEPESFIKIYHTIDREEDRVKCFLLGNNIKFHNPYHINPIFNIPFTPQGKIWTSENVLFQNYKISTALETKSSSSKFIRMIQNSNYSDYAVTGNYTYDNNSFIKKFSGNGKYILSLELNQIIYGVKYSPQENLIYITESYDPSCNQVYALNVTNRSEGSILSKNATPLRWLATYYRNSKVRFENNKIKEILERNIIKLL